MASATVLATQSHLRRLPGLEVTDDAPAARRPGQLRYYDDPFFYELPSAASTHSADALCVPGASGRSRPIFDDLTYEKQNTAQAARGARALRRVRAPQRRLPAARPGDRLPRRARQGALARLAPPRDPQIREALGRPAPGVVRPIWDSMCSLERVDPFGFSGSARICRLHRCAKNAVAHQALQTLPCPLVHREPSVVSFMAMASTSTGPC